MVQDSFEAREVLSSRRLYSGRVWDVVHESFELNEQRSVLERDYIDHPGAVAVVVLNDQQQILLIKQYRHPVSMSLWEIPAGLLDIEGEDPVRAAARELAEEADLEAQQWYTLGNLFTSPGSSNEALRVYLARELTWLPHEHRHERSDEESELEFRWVSLEQARDSILAGSINNGTAIAGILMALSARDKDNFESVRSAQVPWNEHVKYRGHH